MEQSTSTRRSALKRLGTWAAGLLLVAFMLAYVGISLFTADRLTRPTNRPARIDPRRWNEAAQPWSTRTVDGITLRGWYLPTPERRHLVVLVHGMWSSWLEMASLGRDLHGEGFDVILFDLRGHGESDPSRLYLGRRERADIRAVMTWARSQGFPHDRVGWLGYSMGGSTVLMEAARNPEIQVAVLDSPYGNLPKLLDQQLSEHSGLPAWFNPGILLAAAGFTASDRRPGADAVRAGVGRAPAPGDSRRIGHDRSREPGPRAGARRWQLMPDQDAPGRRPCQGLRERP